MINYDKKTLTVLRAVLLAVGAAVGYLAIWQYFSYYPDVVRAEFQIVIAVVCSALCALFLALSAKAFYRLGMSVKQGVLSVGNSLGMRGVFATVLGFLAAGAFVVGFDVMIRRYLDIWAVRLITDILLYIVCAVVCCYAFTAWLKSSDKKQKSRADVGYLMSAQCFGDERVITALSSLINVKVSGGAYQALCLMGDEGALRLLNALVKQGSADVIPTDKQFSDIDDYYEYERKLAESKRLRLITADGDWSLNVFIPPTAEMKAPVDNADTEKEVCKDGEEEVVNGQIIIDK